MRSLFIYLKNYKKETILAPLFKMLEASFELLVPLVMAAVIDKGIAQKDSPYIIRMCLVLIVLGIVGLICSLTAQYFSAKIMPILNRNQAEQINDLVAEYGADSFILACDRAVVDKNRSITHIANLLEKARRSRNRGQSVNVESILDELIERAGQS